MLLPSLSPVCLFADISGFTNMSEALGEKYGPDGAQNLAKHLNGFFAQMVRQLASAGGDVFKYAGDAMICLWPTSEGEKLANLVRRAMQCAVAIQDIPFFQGKPMQGDADGIALRVKVGIAAGKVTLLHLGGCSEQDGSQRLECIAVGQTLTQAFDAEHQAVAGDIICHGDTYKMVSKFFVGEDIVTDHGSFMKVTGLNPDERMLSKKNHRNDEDDDEENEAQMWRYVPLVVAPFLEPGMDSGDWGSELRLVTVLFVNLGFSEESMALLQNGGTEAAEMTQKLQDVFSATQESVMSFEGTINKFLVDDKGSTLIAVFGLPPNPHENDATRGVLASLLIGARLHGLGMKASIGVTTGTAFCGVVGSSGNRREYTVLGDVVNLSARLMQRAGADNVHVYTDSETSRAACAQNHLQFMALDPIMVKGKKDLIPIFRPFPKISEARQQLLSVGSKENRKGSNLMAGMLVDQFAIEETYTSVDEPGVIDSPVVTNKKMAKRGTATPKKESARLSEGFFNSFTPTEDGFVGIVPENGVVSELQQRLQMLGASQSGAAGMGSGVVMIEAGIGQGKSHLVQQIVRWMLAQSSLKQDISLVNIKASEFAAVAASLAEGSHWMWSSNRKASASRKASLTEDKESYMSMYFEDMWVRMLLQTFEGAVAFRLAKARASTFNKTHSDIPEGKEGEEAGDEAAKEEGGVEQGSEGEAAGGKSSGGTVWAGTDAAAQTEEAAAVDRAHCQVLATELYALFEQANLSVAKSADAEGACTSQRQAFVGLLHRMLALSGLCRHDPSADAAAPSESDGSEQGGLLAEALLPDAEATAVGSGGGVSWWGLVVPLLLCRARQKPLLVVIDDTHNLNLKSWLLALELCKAATETAKGMDGERAPGLLVLMTSRVLDDVGEGKRAEGADAAQAEADADDEEVPDVMERAARKSSAAFGVGEGGSPSVGRGRKSSYDAPVQVATSPGDPTPISSISSTTAISIRQLQSIGGTTRVRVHTLDYSHTSLSVLVKQALGDEAAADAQFMTELFDKAQHVPLFIKDFCDSISKIIGKADPRNKGLKERMQGMGHAVSLHGHSQKLHQRPQDHGHAPRASTHGASARFGGGAAQPKASDDSVKEDDDSIFLSTLRGMPLPPTVRAVLSSRVSRLPITQQLMLKVGSVLEKPFAFDTLVKAYPIECSEGQFAEHFQQLLLTGILSVDRRSSVEMMKKTAAKYSFLNNPCLEQCMQAEMLAAQRGKLEAILEGMRKDKDKQLREDFRKQAKQVLGGYEKCIKEGFATVRKHQAKVKKFKMGGESGMWKKRYLQLFQHQLHILYHQPQAGGMASVDMSAVALFGAKVERAEIGKSGKHKFLLSIEAKEWSKRGQWQDKPRSFLLSFSSEMHLADWLFLLKFAIENADENFRDDQGGDTGGSPVLSKGDSSGEGGEMFASTGRESSAMVYGSRNSLFKQQSDKAARVLLKEGDIRLVSVGLISVCVC
jgi:class 3 adenylate cyclase